MAENKTIKTVFHTYSFNLDKPADSAAYTAFVATRAAVRVEVFKALGNYYAPFDGCDGATVELETSFLFANQWNTAPGFAGSEKGWRVFDWAEDAIFYNGREDTTTRRGHWLLQTAEMREIRANTYVCGYCGRFEPAAKGYVFCPHCLDSEYLKESDLPLLRMWPVATSFSERRSPLTEAERAHLLPLFREAQLHGTTEHGRKRALQRRANVEAKYLKHTRTAREEHDGMLWLLDHSVNTENVIYYDHTETFSFGWRTPLDEATASALLDVLCEFPFAYEIKRANGTKTSTRNPERNVR